jgi:hypothetical protein
MTVDKARMVAHSPERHVGTLMHAALALIAQEAASEDDLALADEMYDRAKHYQNRGEG